MDQPKVVTFDCYGTLIDWEGGAGAFLYDLARRLGEQDPEPARELRRRWHELQFEAIRGPYRSYREVLGTSLRHWVSERGHRWNEGEGHALQRAMESWQPFPDTVPALSRVRAAGPRLGIISNTDRAIIEHTLRSLELDFDEIVVAEDVAAYKPSPEPFIRMLDRLGLESPADILHVAFGFEYDIAQAQRLGMRTAWVNRGAVQAPGDVRPDHELRDLWGLAELVGSR